MSNGQTFRSKKPKPCAPMREGWNEVRLGIPADFDRYRGEADAKNYERGRLLALNVLVTGRKVPAWLSRGPAPSAVTAASREATRLIGSAAPGKRQPDAA